MARDMTDGLPRLWQRVHRKTKYHRDDIRAITLAVMEEIRLMMEGGAARRIQFHKLGSFDIIKTKPKKAYNFQEKEEYIIPPRYVPKFTFNRELVANVKKMEVKDGGILP